MSKLFQNSWGLLRIVQSRWGLVRTTPSNQILLKKGPQSGLVLGCTPCMQSARELTGQVTNQPIRLKNMPTDYPPVTASDHLRRKTRTVFNCFDSNNDGIITKEDFEASARRTIEHLKLNAEQAANILKQRLEMWEFVSRDSKDASQVTEEEFVGFDPSVLNHSTYRKEFFPMYVSVGFKVMDIDGDGLVTKDEHAAYFYSMNVPVEESKKIFDVMDANKDGFISIDEYAHAYAEFLFTDDPNNKYNGFFGPLVD
ncbi:sarcoplasmic calcium-binding protein-like [Lingula anatina]|uniref:Sarcoplasmic calcium-binding protein-like n=1 Tax=Lingula anatina TaxID=7574 RepID=A0A1S3H7M3_LINAN|nr:sarcoplasmic calcium-binding protein-like [Lingula anatina]|eukprot:XP_013381977.1 sarcoplasmic calcium-binding protein-like [Lingula anatina]